MLDLICLCMPLVLSIVITILLSELNVEKADEDLREKEG